jgi:hypothetical protein
MMPMRIPRKARAMEKVENLCRTARVQNVSTNTSGHHACAMLSAAGGMRKARASLNARAAYCATPDAQLRVRRRLPKRIENPADGNCPQCNLPTARRYFAARELAEYESFALGTLGILR